MANQYPEKVKIIYECPCDDQNKKKHHFDYSFPYDVFLLCQRCHMEEHKKDEPKKEPTRTIEDVILELLEYVGVYPTE